MTQLCRIFWFAVLAAPLLCPSQAAAQFAPAWSPLNHIDNGFLTAVSCPSPSFCVAVERTHGGAFIYDGFSWTSHTIDTTGIYSVSCVSPTFCVAGDQNGDVLMFNGSSWSPPQPIDPSFPIPPITAISCASTTFCAAGDDDGNVMIYNGSGWSVPYTLDPVPVASGVAGEGTVTGMSCPNPGFCVAVDQNGKAYTYTGGGWTAPSVVDSNAYFFGVSCASTNFCIAADFNFGAAYTYTGSWSGPSYIDKVSFPSLLAVSCASSTFCVALDGNYGTALTYNGSTWSATPIDTNLENFESVSCPSPTFCVAVDNVGNAVIYRSGLTLGELVDKSMISPGPQSLTYSLVVVSTDQSGTTGVTVTDTLPTGASLVSATSTQGSCSGTQTVVCNIGSLPSGTKAQIAITVTANWAPGKITNTATIAANGYPATSSNTVTTIVRSASDLSIVKTATPATLSTLGDALVYTLTVQNNGPYDVLNAEVIDNLPPHVLLESVSPAQECSGRQSITCNLAIIASGSSAPIALTVIPLVGSVPLLSESLGNTASVTAPFNDDPIASNDSSSVTVNCPYCAPQATTTLTLTSSPNPSAEGQTVVFSARITTNAPSLPSGSVDFSVDGISVATQLLDISGVARYSTSSLTVAAHTITASYAGDNFYRSSSRTLTQTVNASSGGGGTGGGGGSCTCAKGGNYLDPLQPNDAISQLASVIGTGGVFNSPNNRYSVDTSDPTVLLVRKGGQTGPKILELPQNQIQYWGFSPDDDRFVYGYLANVKTSLQQATDNVMVFDLTSNTPNTPIVTTGGTMSGSRSEFSHSGRYFFYARQTGGSHAELEFYQVQGVTQQTLIKTDAFDFSVGSGQDDFGEVQWGFSPDSPESAFVYAYVQASAPNPNTFNWNLLSLSTRQERSDTITQMDAFWKFNPCGDILVRVTQLPPTDPNYLSGNQVQIDLFSTTSTAQLHNNESSVDSLDPTFSADGGVQNVHFTDASGAHVLPMITDPTCAPNTPASSAPVQVSLPIGSDTVQVTFMNGVSAPGLTIATQLTAGSCPANPAGFQVGPVCVDISTTAQFSGNVLVCISDPSITANSHLMHYVGTLPNGAWNDITRTSPPPPPACGVTTSFSPFGVFQRVPVPLTVRANSTMRQYGSPNPVFTASYSGFVNGEDPSVLSGQLSCTSSDMASSPVDSYTIDCSGSTLSSPNYIITYAPGALTVTPAPLTLSADNQHKTYGAPLPALTFSASGFVNGDTAASLTAQPTLSISATAASGVGSYPISISGAVDPNYAISYALGTLAVTPASLIITANNTARQYGQTNTHFTVSYSGFVNGESASVLNGTLSCISPATTSSPVAGSPYAINCSGLTSTNYAITYVAGALTITPAIATTTADNKTKILDAPNPAFTWTTSGFVNGETASVITALPTCSSTAATTSPVGSYPITCSGASAANYIFSYVAGTLKTLYATNIGHVIQPPINANGSSVFNAGRTIPAKFSVYDANGVSIGTPGVVSSFYLTGIISGTVTTAVQDVVDTNNPDTAFRWDPSAQQWVFNITTGGLSAGSTYVYTITLNDGTSMTFQYGLR